MIYDGSINIDTRVDTKGMNKGTKSISSSLGGVLRSVTAVAKAMAAVFIGGSIINGIRSLIGQFDLMGSSIGASVKNLSTAFQGLKSAFVNLILTAFAPLIPYIISFVQWLTQLFNIVTQIISVLFGVQAGFSGVAASAGGAGTAIKKAGKDAKGSLAAFDQINVLAQNKPEDTPNTGGGGGGLPLVPTSPISQDLIDKVNAFKESMLEFLKPVTDGLGRLYDALVPLGQTIWAGLQWAWENILVPIGEWVVNDLIPVFLDLLAEAAVVLNEALIALAPYAKDFFDNFLAPLGQFVGDAIIAFLEMLTKKLGELAVWIRENPEKFANLVKIWASLQLIMLAVVAVLFLILNPIYLVVAAIVAIIAIILNWGKVWEWVKLVASEVWKDIQKMWSGVAGWFRSTVVDPTKKFFSDLWNSIVIGLYNAGVSISASLKNIVNVIANQLQSIQSAFSTVFVAIGNIVKGQINNIIDLINRMISGVVSGINGIINSLNRVGSIVPGFRGIASVAAPQIPRLATGAVIPPNSQFLAVLGDQKSGRNIEAPEGLIRQIFREEMQGGGRQNQTITINFEGTLSALMRELKPYADQENVRIGGSLIKGAG